MLKNLILFDPKLFHVRVHNTCLTTASHSIYLKKKVEEREALRNINAAEMENSSTRNHDNTTPSRIFKDPFHIMQMISLSHGMSKEFRRQFRDAMFIDDEEDKARFTPYLQRLGKAWHQLTIEKSDFVLERVRRYILPPQELFEKVNLLFQRYGSSVCKKSGKALFNEDAWKSANHVLEEIRLGHVSDLVDGPPLYTERGLDKHGLMRYSCARGTSSVEGAVHMNLVRKFASYNAGPRLTDMCLADYRNCHNIDAGSKNRHGQIYKWHYSPWLLELINLYKVKLGHQPVKEYFCNRLGSSLEYRQTVDNWYRSHA
ncbi:unnamed protein product [Mucor hiemalis]